MLTPAWWGRTSWCPSPPFSSYILAAAPRHPHMAHLPDPCVSAILDKENRRAIAPWGGTVPGHAARLSWGIEASYRPLRHTHAPLTRERRVDIHEYPVSGQAPSSASHRGHRGRETADVSKSAHQAHHVRHAGRFRRRPGFPERSGAATQERPGASSTAPGAALADWPHAAAGAAVPNGRHPAPEDPSAVPAPA